MWQQSLWGWTRRAVPQLWFRSGLVFQQVKFYSWHTHQLVSLQVLIQHISKARNGQMQPWDQSGFVCVSLVFWKAFFYCTYTVIRYNIIINMKNSEGWRRRDCVFNVWTPGLLYSAAVFTPCPCNFYHNNCKIFMGQRWMCGCVEAWTRARLLLVNAKENRELLKCKDL